MSQYKAEIRKEMERVLLDDIDNLDVQTLVGIVRRSREQDLAEMSDSEVAEWFQNVADYDEAPDRRVSTEHEEDVIGDRAHCRKCGWVDDIEEPTLEQIYYHQDSFPEPRTFIDPPAAQV